MSCLSVPAQTSCHLKEVDLYLHWRWRCACVCCGVGCVGGVCLRLCLCLVWLLSSLWCCLSVAVWWIVVDALSAVHCHSQQTWRHLLATCQRVMVTLIACPRLFEFLTTLTFGAQRRNHIVSTALRPSENMKRQGRHLGSAIYHELSRTQPKLQRKSASVGVDALTVVA